MPTYYVSIPVTVTDAAEVESQKSRIRVAVWAHNTEDAVDRVRSAIEQVTQKEDAR